MMRIKRIRTEDPDDAPEVGGYLPKNEYPK